MSYSFKDFEIFPGGNGSVRLAVTAIAVLPVDGE